MRTFGEHLDQVRKYEEEISLFSYLSKDTHKIVDLGSVDGNAIYMFESTESDGTMVTSGWQGDEPAGWEAAKSLVKIFPRTSFIPYAVPSAFKSRQHKNDYGMNPDAKWPNPLTPEGKIFLSNIERLVQNSKKMFLSLQEDPKRFICYYYGWKTSSEVEEIIEVGLKNYFPLSEGMKHTPREGMFGEFIVANGCKMAIQLETPADGSYPISKRIDCLVDVTTKLLKGAKD